MSKKIRHTFSRAISCSSSRRAKKVKESYIYLEGSEVLYGYFPVLLALQSQLRQVFKLFITKHKLSLRQKRIVELATRNNIDIDAVDSHVLDMLARREDKERGVHQGICVDVSSIPIQYINEYPINASRRTDILLSGIKDPFNMGSIIRSSYFLGVNDVFISEDYKTSSISPIVSKASSGTLEIHPPKKILNIDSFLKSNNKMLIMGSEDKGIDSNLTKYCTNFVTIPPGRDLHPDVDSLNVSTASAVLISELMRTNKGE
ncbi:MRM1 [Lepeophtheirus salmonis]|uniref:rRNA methyltransferase 1, mitochondrial n=1 Tax=Lepeophtheirus salmonis TaxID=72036 RepID=A0A7R8HB02_LEPSM|nr:MRM1 [Lepeophtheirus salmonis]CAF2977778.1 MRM1 [Lepeophtheirus salmonis]